MTCLPHKHVGPIIGSTLLLADVNLLKIITISNYNQSVPHYLADYWMIIMGGRLIGTSPTVRTNAAIFEATYIQPQAICFAQGHREYLGSNNATDSQSKDVSKPVTPFPTGVSQ